MTQFTNTSPVLQPFTLEQNIRHDPFTGIPSFQQTTGTLPGSAPTVAPPPGRISITETAKQAFAHLPGLFSLKHG